RRRNAVEEALLQFDQQVVPAIEGGEAVAGLEVFDALGRIADFQRGVLRARVTGAEGRPADTDEVRQRVLRSTEPRRRDRAEARVNDAADALAIAGVHVIPRPAVTPLARRHAAEERAVLHDRGHLRQVLADLDAGNGGRNRLEGTGLVLGLGIERVDMT